MRMMKQEKDQLVFGVTYCSCSQLVAVLTRTTKTVDGSMQRFGSFFFFFSFFFLLFFWFRKAAMQTMPAGSKDLLLFAIQDVQASKRARAAENKQMTTDPFEMLPNELVELILCQLPPKWFVLCIFVCSRWRLLLAPFISSRYHHHHHDAKSFAAHCALEGRLNVLQWAKGQGCPWNELVCSSAAWGGHLEVLQWARSQGCPWNSDTCANAARGGHLKVLQWARSQGCPWEEWTCSSAAQGGQLEVLQWARSQGCPWNEHTCLMASFGGHWNVLVWAIRHGCPSYVQD